jgi:negative regulator of sigma E activity
MSEAERSITVEDLRQKAHRIEDMAKAEARRIAERDATKLGMAAVAVVVVALGAAYYLGTRRRCV